MAHIAGINVCTFCSAPGFGVVEAAWIWMSQKNEVRQHCGSKVKGWVAQRDLSCKLSIRLRIFTRLCMCCHKWN